MIIILLLSTLVVDGDSGASQDTADTISVVGASIFTDPDVTIVTPRSSPGVLDVVSARGILVGSPSDEEDGVIKSGTAESSDDTSTVELPGKLVSLDSNGEGTLSSGSNELRLGFLGDALVTSVDLGSFRSLVLAFSVLGSVGIFSFSFNTVGSSVFHSEVRETTSATLGSLAAVNDLLFREGDELAGVDVVKTFEGTGGGEGPA